MFETLRSLTKDPDGLPPKLPFMKRDWKKTMETLDTRIEALEADYAAAVRAHADACLLADEGGDTEAKARDKAHGKRNTLGRELQDAKAALEAAGRRKTIEDEKTRKDKLAERQKRVADLQKELVITSDKMDGHFDDIAATVQKLRDVVNKLRAEGVREAAQPLLNLNRCLASRVRGLGVDLGSNPHPFDDRPVRLMDLCPDLKATIAASEVDTRHIKRAVGD